MPVSFTGCQKANPSAAAANASPPVPQSVLDMETIPRTPERLARGKYLVEGLAQCTFCHSEFDFRPRPAHPVEGKRGGGNVFAAAEIGLPEPNLVVAPNISSDPEYGAGNWKDRDFVRALRQGIGHDGRALFPMMPYQYFRALSDEDLASVIVYERSLAPVHIGRPKTVLTDEVKKTFQPLPAVAHVPEPDKSDRVAYGKYLVTVGHCDGCHSPEDEQGNNLPGLDFSGGVAMDGYWGPNPKQLIRVASLNLTPDPSGIGYFDEAMFIQVIRTGKVKARPLANIMPWAYFRNLTDDDLKAIFAYLRTLKPVHHRVDNTEPARYCKLCRGKHGFGERN
ncbi:MAG TPA: c-type cytochrome [Candidatus Binatia bacterium]|nr:c-type cytochrome [Candidatus Binatia bacterium]